MPDRAGEYVLGTHDAEVARLGVQHEAWRETVLDAWRLAGLKIGDRVIDMGAGPGWATWDLAKAVGPTGEVLAVERSERFVSVLDQEKSRRGLRNVTIRAADLMDLGTCPHGYDLAWCRWVASFTTSVPQLVHWTQKALRPGGVAVFHEYLDYASWRFAPPRAHLQEFVGEVMASWRASGGEPDVAPLLVAELRAGGFRLRKVRPLVFATQPGELTWQWPAGFVATNVARLQELGRVTSEWGDAVLKELTEAEADADSVMITPMVLEVVAQRE